MCIESVVYVLKGVAQNKKIQNQKVIGLCNCDSLCDTGGNACDIVMESNDPLVAMPWRCKGRRDNQSQSSLSVTPHFTSLS